MARTRGGGAIKPIDAAKQDPFEIRRRLHAGGEPMRDKHALLFIHWRNLIAQRDDCAKRLKAGEGDKWTRKRLKQLNREIDDKWRELGAALGGMRDADLSDKLAILSKAARPAVYGWQKEATRIIDILHLASGSALPVESKPAPNRELLAARQTEQAALTPAQRAERIRKRDAAAKAYEAWLNTAEGRAEQAETQAEHAATISTLKKIVTPESDKVLSLAGSNVSATAQKLFDHLRALGYTMTVHDVRRFVRDKLEVTLRSERGKRTDLL